MDVRRSAEKAYTSEMQEALKNTVWRSGCSSWYFAENGWNSTVYPFTQIDFWRRCTFPRWKDWNIVYTSKGLAKIRRTRVTRLLLLTLMVIGTYRVRQNRLGVEDLKAAIRNCLQSYLLRLVQIGTFVKKQIVP